MFDVLILLSQLLLTVGPIIILLNQLSRVPKISSALLVVGLVGMTIGLIGLGAPLGALATAIGATAWAAVFVFRGK